MGYQDAAEEAAIVARHGAPQPPEWVAKVVEVVRRTRSHPDLRHGSSVRGAIDTAKVAASLAAIRGVEPTDPGAGLDAALVALSGRIRVREGVTRSTEDVITELWTAAFGTAADEGDGGKATAPNGATSRS
jgi:MoxR-like ATPase